MDARTSSTVRRFQVALTLALILLLGGCALQFPPARQSEAPKSAESKEAPLIVNDGSDRTHATASQPAGDPLESRINEYLARLDGNGGKSTSRSKLASDETAGPNPRSSGAANPALATSGPPSRVELHTPAIEVPPSRLNEPAKQVSAAPANSPLSVQAEVHEAAPPEPAVHGTETRPPVSPPRLIGVSARGDTQQPARDARIPGANPNAPAINGRPVSAGGAGPATLAEFIENWRKESDDSGFSRQLDTRLMYVVAGDYEKAREPLTLVSDQQRELAARFVEALIAMRDSGTDGLSPNVGPPGEMDRLADALRDNIDLNIPILTVCREVNGFGQYVRMDPPQFITGEAADFVSYLEVRDFRSEQQPDGLFLTRFEMRTRVLNRAGDAVVDVRDPVIEDRCRNRRRDCFVPRLVTLPNTLPPGEYVLKVTLVDKLGSKVAETSTPLQVVAKRRG